MRNNCLSKYKLVLIDAQTDEEIELKANAWQQSEMNRFGLTLEEHNKIIDVSAKLQRFTGYGYDDLLSAMKLPVAEPLDYVIELKSPDKGHFEFRDGVWVRLNREDAE